MKRFTTILIFLFSSFLLFGQERMPYINEILELKWYIELESKRCLPILIDGIVIPGYGVEFAVDAVSGEKKYYGNENFQTIEDSLICFNSKNLMTVVNIHLNEKIVEKEKKSYQPAQRHPYFLPNALSIYIEQPTKLVCNNINNDELIWELKTENTFYDELLIDKNFLVVADKKQLYKVSLNTGSIEWKEDFNKINSNFHLEENILFFGTSDRLVAFNLVSKQVKWEFKINAFRSKIIIEEDKLYYHNDNDLFCIDKNTGNLIWKTNRNEETCDAIYFTLAGNYLLTSVHGYDRTPIISAFDKTSGEEKYSFWKSDTFSFLKETNSQKSEERSSGAGIEFYPYEYNNLIFGVTKKYLFAFQIKTPVEQE